MSQDIHTTSENAFAFFVIQTMYEISTVVFISIFIPTSKHNFKGKIIWHVTSMNVLRIWQATSTNVLIIWHATSMHILIWHATSMHILIWHATSMHILIHYKKILVTLMQLILTSLKILISNLIVCFIKFITLLIL